MTSTPNILAVDQGSSGTKVAVFDRSGRIIAQASRPTEVSHPDVVAAEAEPESWWRALCACLREILDDGRVRADDIEAIGLCGLMHTVVPVGADGNAVGSAILWPDQRGVLGDAPSHVDRLRWWVARHPTTAVAWYLPVKDFLRYRLTGQVGTDAYEAGGTGLFDQAAGGWSSAAARYAGITVDQLPPVASPTSVAGGVSHAAATATGLREGTPVVVGTGDWMSTLLGSGSVLPDRACVYLGTSGVVGAFASASARDRLVEPLCFAATTSTGSALGWLASIVDSRPEELVLAAESAPVGARGLFFLPHLMGERGDGVRPHARGEIVGLTLAHSRADLARAVLEGTAYWLRAIAGDELDRRRPAELVAAGGGAASTLWLRILAAVLDRDIEVPEVAEAGLLGAALLAATGIGVVDNLAAGQERWVRRRGVVRADPVWCQQYQDFYQGFQQAEYRAHPGSGPVASVSQTDPQLAAQRRPAHHPQ